MHHGVTRATKMDHLTVKREKLTRWSLQMERYLQSVFRRCEASLNSVLCLESEENSNSSLWFRVQRFSRKSWIFHLSTCSDAFTATHLASWLVCIKSRDQVVVYVCGSEGEATQIKIKLLRLNADRVECSNAAIFNFSGFWLELLAFSSSTASDVFLYKVTLLLSRRIFHPGVPVVSLHCPLSPFTQKQPN